MVALGIIGTAGRKGLHKILSLDIFKNMCKVAHTIAIDICSKYAIDRLLLVSGGAAWADHVAVSLFKSRPELYALTMYGPCTWDRKAKKFSDNGIRGYGSWIKNPGSTTNYYHKLFSERTGVDSLNDIDACHDLKGFSYKYGEGFYARNGLVANKITHLVAFTFGPGTVPTDGGTLNTWEAARNQGVVCVHKSIHNL